MRTRIEGLPRWVVIWLAISIPIVVWDVAFVLSRPASMPGGSLAFLWPPYAKYITVDKSYGDLHNPFVWAQAILSALEAPLGIAALALHFARRRAALATLLAFTMSAMTCSKTVLILMIEIVSHGQSVGHNAIGDLVALYLVPNGLWVIVPVLVMVGTGRALLAPFTHRDTEAERRDPAISVAATNPSNS